MGKQEAFEWLLLMGYRVQPEGSREQPHWSAGKKKGIRIDDETWEGLQEKAKQVEGADLTMDLLKAYRDKRSAERVIAAYGLGEHLGLQICEDVREMFAEHGSKVEVDLDVRQEPPVLTVEVKGPPGPDWPLPKVYREWRSLLDLQIHYAPVPVRCSTVEGPSEKLAAKWVLEREGEVFDMTLEREGEVFDMTEETRERVRAGQRALLESFRQWMKENRPNAMTQHWIDEFWQWYQAQDLRRAASRMRGEG